MDKKILITGSNGFISKNLKNYLLLKKYKVNNTNRIEGDISFFDLKDNSYSKNKLPKFDILIHLAYLRSSSYLLEKKYNFHGSKNIFNIAKNFNAKIIYISSQSASQNSKSNYGKIKYEIEQLSNEYNANIIRPGLVYDLNTDLGLYGRISILVKKMPFLLVPNGLKKKINLCNIDTLFSKINDLIISENDYKKITLYEDQKYTLEALIKKIAEINNKKIFIIPINYKIIYYIIKTLEILNIKLPISSDSIKSIL